MPPQSSDDVVRQAREVRPEQIQDCSQRAAKKILAKFKAGKPSTEVLAALIAAEFEELNR